MCSVFPGMLLNIGFGDLSDAKIVRTRKRCRNCNLQCFRVFQGRKCSLFGGGRFFKVAFAF